MMWEKRIKNLKLLLNQIIGGELSIESYKTDELSAGENYQSKIISVDLKDNKRRDTDQNCNLSIIVKMLPMIEGFREVCELNLLFKKEISMYEIILPAYKRFEIDSGFSESEVLKFAPVYYGSKLNPNAEVNLHEDDDTFIVLENLRKQGYYKVDRKIGADLNHSKLTIRAMAKFHSVGIAMKHKNPEEFKIMKKESTRLEVKHPEDWIGVIENIFKLIASDPMIEKYINSCQKLYKLEEDHRTFTPPEPWSSIIHGDFTTSNILFHQCPDNSIPDDVKFVDFQLHTFTSPLRELAFFLATSTNQQVFNNHYDELLDLYYETLNNRLTLFGVDTELYSRESFTNQYRQDARLHFPHCVTVSQIVTLDFEKEDEAIENLIKILENSGNDIFCNKLRDIILLYHNRGWFD